MASLKALPAACLAEFFAMALFVIFGCGSAMGIASARSASDASLLPGWVLLVSLVFGLAIAVLVYSIAHISGAHINCAVTFGLVLGGHTRLVEGLAYFVSQMLGSVVGAWLLMLIYPADMDQTKGLGSNGISDGWNWYNAFVGEIVGTCLLVTVVLQTACNPDSAANRSQAALAIGLSVFLAHSILIPIDGCSINPTRSFGPALVAHFRYAHFRSAEGEKSPFKDMWIFWLAPLIGAAVAVFLYETLRLLTPRKESEENKEEVAGAQEAREVQTVV